MNDDSSFRVVCTHNYVLLLIYYLLNVRLCTRHFVDDVLPNSHGSLWYRWENLLFLFNR